MSEYRDLKLTLKKDTEFTVERLDGTEVETILRAGTQVTFYGCLPSDREERI